MPGDSARREKDRECNKTVTLFIEKKKKKSADYQKKQRKEPVGKRK